MGLIAKMVLKGNGGATLAAPACTSKGRVKYPIPQNKSKTVSPRADMRLCRRASGYTRKKKHKRDTCDLEYDAMSQHHV